MDYGDEAIIAKRTEAKIGAKTKRIQKEVNLDGEIFDFEPRLLFDDRVSIMIPERFGIMDAAKAKIKYPSENRPQLIYSDASCRINLLFNLMDEPLQETEILNRMLDYRAVIKRTNPANVFYEWKILKRNEGKVGYFDYKSYAIDDDIYNIMFVTNVQDKLLLGAFNCPLTHKKDWKLLVLQMLNTIEEMTRDEQ